MGKQQHVTISHLEFFKKSHMTNEAKRCMTSKSFIFKWISFHLRSHNSWRLIKGPSRFIEGPSKVHWMSIEGIQYQGLQLSILQCPNIQFESHEFYWSDSCLQFALHRLKTGQLIVAFSQRVQVLKLSLDRKIVESHVLYVCGYFLLAKAQSSSYKLKHQVDKRIFAFLSLLASVNPPPRSLELCWWSKLSHYSHSVTTYTLNKIFVSAVAVGGLISLTGLCSGQFISNVRRRRGDIPKLLRGIK